MYYNEKTETVKGGERMFYILYTSVDSGILKVFSGFSIENNKFDGTFH